MYLSNIQVYVCTYNIRLPILESLTYPVLSYLTEWRRNIYGHSGLVRTKFLENHIKNAIGDSRFYSIVLISPDQVLKSGPSCKTLLRHCTVQAKNAFVANISLGSCTQNLYTISTVQLLQQFNRCNGSCPIHVSMFIN